MPQDRQEDLAAPGLLDRLTAGLAALAENIRQGGPPLADRLPGTFAGAEREIPATWRRRLDPHGRGLTIPQLLACASARRHLAGKPPRRPARVTARPRARCQVRPRARRTGASSASAGSDPGEGGDSEPPGDATPALLRTAQLAGSA